MSIKGKGAVLLKGKKVLVKQTRSIAGRTVPVRDTIKALGLGKIGSEREFTLNESVIGMLQRVDHLIEVAAV